MLSSEERKEAVRKYKERKIPMGTFAVRCTASGRVWIGSSRNLEAAKNSAWFGLRQGNHIDKALQKEWNLHGADNFEFEILETLDEDANPFEITDRLKEKKQGWLTRLGALSLY